MGRSGAGPLPVSGGVQDLRSNVRTAEGLEDGHHLLAHVTCPSYSLAEQGQPVDGFVAEDESDVTTSDVATPAAHGCRRDPLFQKAIRDVDAVEAQRGDVQEQ